MIQYQNDFCRAINFPREAIEALELSYQQLEEQTEGYARFLELVEFYQEHNEKSDRDSIISDLTAIAEETGIHKYTLYLLYFIALSKHTRTLYQERGIPDQLFLDTMHDLTVKLTECHQLHDVWGSAVPGWGIRLFNLQLMTHGRLQFEVIPYDGEYQGKVYGLKTGDPVLNVHIPSGKPLDIAECEESFRRAAEFYRGHFGNRPVAFVCTSWLLFSAHRKILPASSNILKFMDFFDVVPSRETEEMGDLWRIFYKDSEKDIADLPRNSSLQRAYADWLMAGNSAGVGHGVFFIE